MSRKQMSRKYERRLFYGTRYSNARSRIWEVRSGHVDGMVNEAQSANEQIGDSDAESLQMFRLLEK
jgi:hypothetical protein